ncbi:hypothetical protein RRG08_046939 [Elysia crispata]|uniref:Uncharacterized protein n=1 Tax=Elysia crispata TaxID=231223 RepID=A0AAE1A8V5_9GAST|nr:hypothetical protein RRG08_046939 [Elysia crispata]
MSRENMAEPPSPVSKQSAEYSLDNSFIEQSSRYYSSCLTDQTRLIKTRSKSRVIREQGQSFSHHSTSPTVKSAAVKSSDARARFKSVWFSEFAKIIFRPQGRFCQQL